MRKLTTEEFIERAKQIHGDKYDYSLVEYVNNRTKVKIICPMHGVFEQLPANHINHDCGCPLCADNITKNTEWFIRKAKEIHGDKYDYSLVNYVNNCIKVKIICPIHGVFEQLPVNHINQKRGCQLCANNIAKTTEQFILAAKEVHGDKYDYSFVEYKNKRTKIKIVCPKHGIFEQRPDKHLEGCGCPFCSTSKGEEQIRKILKKNKMVFEEQKKFNDLKDKKNLSYDFYLPSKNLLVEYNGEQHYKNNSFKNHNFLLQKHHDWLKRKYARKNNINLLVIPYWDFDNIEKILKKVIN